MGRKCTRCVASRGCSTARPSRQRNWPACTCCSSASSHSTQQRSHGGGAPAGGGSSAPGGSCARASTGTSAGASLGCGKQRIVECAIAAVAKRLVSIAALSSCRHSTAGACAATAAATALRRTSHTWHPTPSG